VTRADDAWRAGHRLLAARVAALPELLARVLAEAPPRSRLETAAVAGIVVTGVGSSAAHARLLAWLLVEHAGLRARFRPLGDFVGGGAARDDEALIVVSQGLSPNARLALAEPGRWRHVALVTASGPPAARAADDPRAAEKRRLVADLRARGVEVHGLGAGEDEYGTLVRVVGPMAGYLCVLRLAAGLAAAAGGSPPYRADDLARVPNAVAAAGARVCALDLGDPGALLGGRLAFLARGSYAELVDNLRYKVLEGMLRPLPPVWDLLHLAHGPLQELAGHATTLLALTRSGDAAAADLLARAVAALEPDGHRVLPLAAELPGSLALFEHEAAMNELMLRFVAARGIDQVDWPGRGREAALYDLGRMAAASSGGDGEKHGDRSSRATRSLAALTWPEVERACAAGPRTAVLALGSTEQHGPHLPCGTDTWIAEALAARFAAAVPEAVVLPVLPVGCAAEHLDFPGTLHLRPETLTAALVDLMASLRRHGFASAFVFSAHGGNFAPLAAALPALRAAAAPMTVAAFTDLARLTALWHAESAAYGVGAAASGHHAGELETSIVRALRPDAVRASALVAGTAVAAGADAQALFYPSLRPHAPSGTVGDPRAADAARGERYLAAWVELLLAAYRSAKKSA